MAVSKEYDELQLKHAAYAQKKAGAMAAAKILNFSVILPGYADKRTHSIFSSDSFRYDPQLLLTSLGVLLETTSQVVLKLAPTGLSDDQKNAVRTISTFLSDEIIKRTSNNAADNAADNATVIQGVGKYNAILTSAIDAPLKVRATNLFRITTKEGLGQAHKEIFDAAFHALGEKNPFQGISK